MRKAMLLHYLSIAGPSTAADLAVRAGETPHATAMALKRAWRQRLVIRHEGVTVLVHMLSPRGAERLAYFISLGEAPNPNGGAAAKSSFHCIRCGDSWEAAWAEPVHRCGGQVLEVRQCESCLKRSGQPSAVTRCSCGGAWSIDD